MASGTSIISLKRLSSSVDGAVKAALDRHKLKTTNQFILNPGILAGPLLDPATDLRVAQQVAEDVTKQVQQQFQSGPMAEGAEAEALAARPLQAGVLVTKRWIICGFFPYEVPQFNVEKF